MLVRLPLAIMCLLAMSALASAEPELPVAIKQIDLDGEIEPGLAAYVERVLDDAKKPSLIVLRVNTFGGRIDSAVRIRDAMLRCKVPTLAFVEGRAISAGALITLAADHIYMTEGATIGAATPVQIQGDPEGQSMKPVEAKIVSYFRKEMKATAEAKHHRGDLAEAMVDAAVEIPGVDGKETTLTLTAPEALKLKLIDGVVRDRTAALLAQKWVSSSSGHVEEVKANWAERVARVLSDSRVSSLLMTLGMIGVLIELWAPGHLMAGLFGAGCLLLFFFGHYVVHLAGFGEIALFVGGVLVVIVEVAFIPGHGMLGVVGALAIVASLVMALVGRSSLPLEVSWALGSIGRALAMVSGAILASTVTMIFVARKLPSTRFGRALVLDAAIKGTAAPVDRASLGFGPHSEGRAVTALRPAGVAELNGQRVDVVSDGGFIEAGDLVRVVKADGTRVVVVKVS